MVDSLNEISVNEIIMFCEEWKCRDEIQEKYDMTNMQSWKMFRFLEKLTEMEVKKALHNYHGKKVIRLRPNYKQQILIEIEEIRLKNSAI